MQNNLKHSILLIFTLFVSINVTSKDKKNDYREALNNIKSMLVGDDAMDFKKAVFITENAYLENKLSNDSYNDVISFYSSICKGIAESNAIAYIESDKEVAMMQCGTFIFFTDSVPVIVKNEYVTHPPFSYNYTDFVGQEDWTNMFVSKLIQTYQGNCHSLPYLYKIIMDELGYKSHLALAPNHIYIKANNKKVGWYNIELTCGDFPTDAWYAASGYIHTDAIRNGIYMRALSDKEAVAMTLVDLAQGYQAKFGVEDGSFILKCCDTALEHFPKYINAMLLKSEILTELYRESNSEEIFSQMTELYTHIHELGYRKMPQQMYTNWMNSLSVEDRNQGIKAILNPSTKIE